MKFVLRFYLILCLVFISCTQSYIVKKGSTLSHNEKKINAMGDRKTGKLFLRGGETIIAENIQIATDTLKYIDSETLKDSSLAITDISKISFTDRLLGFAHGFYLGTGITLLLGAVLYAESDEPIGSYSIVGIIGAGGLISGLTGAYMGGKHEFKYENNHK